MVYKNHIIYRDWSSHYGEQKRAEKKAYIYRMILFNTSSPSLNSHTVSNAFYNKSIMPIQKIFPIKISIRL